MLKLPATNERVTCECGASVFKIPDPRGIREFKLMERFARRGWGRWAEHLCTRLPHSFAASIADDHADLLRACPYLR